MNFNNVDITCLKLSRMSISNLITWGRERVYQSTRARFIRLSSIQNLTQLENKNLIRFLNCRAKQRLKIWRKRGNLEKSFLWHKHPPHLTRKSDTQGTESGEERLSNPNDPRNFKIYVWCGDMVNCGEQTNYNFRIMKGDANNDNLIFASKKEMPKMIIRIGR